MLWVNLLALGNEKSALAGELFVHCWLMYYGVEIVNDIILFL
jgi:hypothetical protein